jgi:hypothetical protein
VDAFTPPPLVVRPPCAGLLDQGRHACHNDATETYWLGGVGWRLCGPCADMARADSPRLTLPLWRAFVGDDGSSGAKGG